MHCTRSRRRSTSFATTPSASKSASSVWLTRRAADGSRCAFSASSSSSTSRFALAWTSFCSVTSASGLLRILVRRLAFWRRLNQPRAVRLRLALEALGPIFVKFGQVLSTRRDLLPADIADELAKLQDRVPPFPSELVVATLERVYGKPFKDIFASFTLTPEASASVAQVHFARLPDGTEAAVKVLRPGIEPAIRHDVALMYSGAMSDRAAVERRQAPAAARSRRRVRAPSGR